MGHIPETQDSVLKRKLPATHPSGKFPKLVFQLKFVQKPSTFVLNNNTNLFISVQ